LLDFSSSEKPKGKWLTFKGFLKISLAENFVMPPVKIVNVTKMPYALYNTGTEILWEEQTNW